MIEEASLRIVALDIGKKREDLFAEFEERILFYLELEIFVKNFPTYFYILSCVLTCICRLIFYLFRVIANVRRFFSSFSSLSILINIIRIFDNIYAYYICIIYIYIYITRVYITYVYMYI